MGAERTAVLVGAGQLTQRDPKLEAALNPVQMMSEAALRAADDCGAGPKVLEQIDYLGLVGTLGWQASNPARLVAEAIAARPAREVVSTVGGETPQAYVNHIAGEIAAGRVRLALIAGCNAWHSARLATQRGSGLDWPRGGEGKPLSFGDARPGTNDYENRHGLLLPSMIYPLFENAFRFHQGWDLDTHRRKLGELFSGLSRVAAENPHAWFPIARSAEEIATPSAENRMVAFPYTKYMNAVINVDQSAAILMASTEAARELGIPRDRWVYLLGSGDAYEDPWFLSERPSFSACPALRYAGEQALQSAGVGVDEIDLIDLYSCFPVAVEVACEMLGIPAEGARPLTVTGGLPFFGGPGNNYSTHAIASMMERLRERPGALGLVTANGWYLTKHAIGVYSTEPSGIPATAQPAFGCRPAQSRVAVAIEASGPATVETYTVLFGRDGRPNKGIVVGRLENGERFLANTPDDPTLAEALTTRELIGRMGVVRPSAGVNLFEPS